MSNDASNRCLDVTSAGGGASRSGNDPGRLQQDLGLAPRGTAVAEALRMKRLIAPAALGLLLSLAPDASAAPKIHVSCNGFPVLTAQHVASQYANQARDRMNQLAKMSKAERKQAWKNGAEKTWFGAYSEARFKDVRKITTTIATVLSSSKLRISCDKNYPNWAQTWDDPFEYIFVLGKPWLYGMLGMSAARLSGERVVTLLHEAAHQGGANRGEVLGRSYADAARKRAKHNAPSAARSAENHGYYAMCRASASPACNP